MSEKDIYKLLRDAGMTAEGACAMLGNMKAESGLKADIAQRGMTKMTDEQYTAFFNRNPEACYQDAVGYGLCQWTYWTRKKALRQFADNWGVSVGAEDMQIAFCIEELKTDYLNLWNYLCTANDLYTATERICVEYERPAVNNVENRYVFAQDFFERLVIEEILSESPNFPPDPSIMMLQTILSYNGYTTEITGYKTEQFFSKLKEFVKDIGG